MSELILGEQEHGSGLFPRLQREIYRLKEIGLDAAVDRCELGGRIFYRLAAERGDPAQELPEAAELLRTSAALAVSETVLEEIEPLVLDEIVRKLRPAYPPEERAQVVGDARSLALRLVADVSSERNRVVERAAEYLDEQPLLLIDGFVRFRLKEYCDELADCVRQAIDDHEFEKERAEFISLLRDFVEGRPEGVQEVHVLPGDNERFRLVDPTGSPVETSYLDEFTWALVDEGHVDMEELLITTLVALAPGKVVCHRPIETRDVPMVHDVFRERLDYCAGCPLCQGPAAPSARPRTR